MLSTIIDLAENRFRRGAHRRKKAVVLGQMLGGAIRPALCVLPDPR